MSYRTVAFNWLPRTKAQWNTFTQARQEAAALWNAMVLRHARIRRLGWRFPTKARWDRWVKRRFPNLHSQSAQHIVGEFDEAVRSAQQLRKNGQDEARYPHRLLHYRDIPYTNQAGRVVTREGERLLILPNGKAGKLAVRLPDGVQPLGRLVEIRLAYGKIMLVYETLDPPTNTETTVGVDLGVNTLIAATDGKTALLISGRAAKATVQWRNKCLAGLVKRQSKHQRGSRRYKRLQKRKFKMLDKALRRVKDITHKATRKVKAIFPQAQVYVGKPFNSAAQKVGRVAVQQVSSACNRKIIDQLNYKMAGALEVSETYSSQTCPVCGCRHKCRRTYACHQCGYTVPRDVVGAVNILRLGMYGSLAPSRNVPTRIIFLRPTKYLRPTGRSSSGGHPGNSSCK